MKSFYKGYIPLALVHMGVVHNEDIPHWIVVTDIKDDHVIFNDPCPPKGGKNVCVSRDEFQQMLLNVGPRNGLTPSVVFEKNCKMYREK